MKKNWTIFNGLLAAVVSLMLMTGCSDENSTSSVSTGKVIQSPVAGATVFLDINGNRVFDEGEPNTKTDANGSYTLNIPDGKEGLICSVGGTVTGKGTEALPMLAPRDAGNITAITTLVAINPGLKATFGPRWNSDPYEVIEKKEPDGTITRYVDGSLLQVKFVIEALQSALASSQASNFAQFSAMSLLAGKLSDTNIEYDAGLEDAVEAFLEELQQSQGKEALPDAKVSAIKAIAFAVIDEIDDEIAEADLAGVTKKAESKLFSKYAVNFSPPSVLPLPNDLAWAATGGKVVFDTENETDPAKKALYTALNKLQLDGLSPNTPISIPLTSSAELVSEDLTSAVKIFEVPAFIPVEDFTAIHDSGFIKIYPTSPLDDGKKYAVVLKKGIEIKGAAEGAELGTNPVFEMIKPSYTASLPDAFAALQPLKAATADLFKGLANLDTLTNGLLESIPENDILMLFTFTTAAKTLSATDFAVMQATIAAGGDPDDMTITGLDYTSVTGEYAPMNGSVSVARVPTMTVDADSFTSWTVSTLAKLLMLALPDDEEVPYTIFNGSSYTDTVVVFQHGFGGSKDNAQNFTGTSHPVIAMDLPYHGDRTPEGKTSGSEYLTTNLPQNRMNLYQSFYDMSVLIQGLKAGKFDIDGDGTPDTPSTIHFAGQSLGAITGSVAAKYNQASLGKVVLNVGGANFASILDTATNAALTGLLDKLGVEKNSVQYFVTLGVLQLIMDPCDPMYLAADLAINPDIETIFQFAYKDTLVSNVSNEILATVAESDDVVEVKEFSTNVTFENGKPYLFGNADDKNDSWIPHGFLLDPRVTVDGELKYPEAEGFMDEDYATEAHSAVVTWTTDYLN
jgi:pimeloyl-ACP methyl ester carboxylesterase